VCSSDLNGIQFETWQVSPPFSVYASQGVACGTLYIHSDRRIKKDIIELEDNECLNKLRLLKPCKYKYIEKDTDTYIYGFIAQEVKETIPYSTELSKTIIPDYYKIVEIVDYDISNIRFKIDETINYDLSVNQLIKLSYEYKKTTEDSSYLYIDEEINVKDINGKIITVENKINAIIVNQIFFYGKQVDDMHNLKKDAIWTVATSALQEVDRIQQRHEQEITSLKQDILDLKSQNQLLLQRLEALESRLA